MTDTVITEVRKSLYLDSVVLMRMSRAITQIDGVFEAAMMMGTPANIEIMTDAGLLDDVGRTATGGDLVIGIRAADKISANAALDAASTQLEKPQVEKRGNKEWHPKTLRTAIKEAPNSNLALISVAGQFAVSEARKAIRRGLNVMIFSDNVSLLDEVELKREAKKLDRLIMGPDCGTAIINGVPLAFSNVVPRGSIGIVGASGTGMQEVASLIGQYGGGISHAVGVGGRDLRTEVGGISTLMAIDALDSDPNTDKIVVISKPPSSEVGSKVLQRIGESSKTSVICFIGGRKLAMPVNATQVFTLKDTACTVMDVSHSDAEPVLPTGFDNGGRLIKGLFSGGTLCAEAQVLLQQGKNAVYSNIPVANSLSMAEGGQGHVLLDLGDDQYTKGKPHPMIDPSGRNELILSAVQDRSWGAILLDVVIGFGAHRDPAGLLVDLLNENEFNDAPQVFASVTGTEDDPQVRSRQVKKLAQAGIIVAPTNADAARWALSFVERSV
ncbi:MAG: oxidoreductase [Magnetovibrio sp.]|nr:oxidoreductase [Magnetovibrio sp.]